MQISTSLNWRPALLVGLLFSCFAAYGQEAPIKYGKVSDDEVKMKVFAADTSAAAVILADYGRSYFTYTNDFQIVFERIVRIKILKKSGYDWANMVVPYFQRNAQKEQVGSIKGTTYNYEGGKIVKVKMENSAIFDEKESANWSNKKFALPAVKEGSVLEIAYTITSDFLFNLREWNFQYSIPVVHSEYRASIPKFFEYKQLSQGYEAYKVQESLPGTQNITIRHSGGFVGSGFRTQRVAGSSETESIDNMNYRWVMKDVPAITSESYITTLNDYVSKIEFELEWVRFPNSIPKNFAGNWASLSEDLMADEQFGLQLNRTGFFKNEVANLPAATDTLARLSTIYDLVKRSVKWNGNGGKYVTTSLRKAFDNKAGNVADINLMLVAMLRDAGFKANPVVLSTRDHGRTPYTPALAKFNYVIAMVHVGNKHLLLDATDPYMPLGNLPRRCLNGTGRIINENGGDWVTLQSADRTTELMSGDLKILPTGSLTGKVSQSVGGLWAVNLRRSIISDGEEKYLEKIVNNQTQLERKKPTIDNLKEIYKPMGLNYEVTSLGDTQEKDIIYLNPMLLKAPEENPFKLATRKYPVDFAHPSEEVYICNFTIPDGYAVEEMPKSIALTLPENAGKFTYMLQVTGNRIQVMSKISISKSVFYAEEYEYLKQFYTTLVAKQAEQIVLRKKG